MGIKHFFSWFKKRFPTCIHNMKKGETFADVKDESINDGVDTLMIDMNGIFHTSAQKVYRYGDYKEPQRFLGPRKPVRARPQDVYTDVCRTVDEIVNIANPRKYLVLCVDGPAPLSKQTQQRQRRFASAAESSSDCQFDSNCITPGTKFMDHLGKYIDWYIRKKVTTDPKWAKLKIVFSNEKVPGEGEHKLINFIRLYGQESETFCLHGMDADLIMLALGTHMPKFWIIRDEPMGSQTDYYAVNIGSFRHELSSMLDWSKDPSRKKKFKVVSALNDFIFICFTVGNDFLPHIPAIEIIEGGIDFMINTYKATSSQYGHITKKDKSGGLRFRRRSLEVFIGTLAQYEKNVFENKLEHKDVFFPDPILESCAKYSEGKYQVDINKYRKKYYRECLGDVKDMEDFCHQYLDGMQWVLTYYTKGVPDWRWFFPHHYAPFAATLAKHISTYKFKTCPETTPTLPFIQLLNVLPPKSAGLLPQPLNNLLTSEKSPLVKYCPKKLTIDLAGKRQKWEGIVILPELDFKDVENCYEESRSQIDVSDTKRNILGKTFFYEKSDYTSMYNSFYGNFLSSANVKFIQL